MWNKMDHINNWSCSPVYLKYLWDKSKCYYLPKLISKREVFEVALLGTKMYILSLMSPKHKVGWFQWMVGREILLQYFYFWKMRSINNRAKKKISCFKILEFKLTLYRKLVLKFPLYQHAVNKTGCNIPSKRFLPFFQI